MGDAADILGIKKKEKQEGFESAIGGPAEPKRKRVSAKPPNVSREVYALLGGNRAGERQRAHAHRRESELRRG